MDKPQGRGMETSRKHIVTALCELEAIRSSSKFLSALSGNLPGDTYVSSQHSCSTASGRRAVGFEESVNRRLLAPSPPRCIKIVSWDEVSLHPQFTVLDFWFGFHCSGNVSRLLSLILVPCSSKYSDLHTVCDEFTGSP